VPLVGKLKEVLGLYLESMSDVNVEVSEESSETQIMNLVNNRSDVGLLRLPVLHQLNDIKLLTLFSEKVVVAVGPTHPLSSRKSISLTELREEPFVSIAHPKRGGLVIFLLSCALEQDFLPSQRRFIRQKVHSRCLFKPASV
jgi:DNA-binding transcriptional LysR family regulator